MHTPKINPIIPGNADSLVSSTAEISGSSEAVGWPEILENKKMNIF